MDEWEAADLKENYMVVNSTTQTVQHGGGTLEILPGLVKKVIRNKCWRKMLWGDELIEYSSFEECVTARMPRGMGTTIQRIKDLCQRDTDVIDMIVKETTNKPGGANNPYGCKGKDEVINADNISNDSKPRNEKHGTSLDYTLRRLRKEAPELHAEVINKAMTPNAAAVKAGFRVNPIQLNPVDPVKAAKTVKRAIADGKIDMDYFDRFCSEVRANG